MKKTGYKKEIILLMVISFAIRWFLSVFLEFGNDEVYYRLYALYPALSYFDHPLMVALIMRMFSLNLLFQSVAFLRLGSVVLGTVNIWLVYQIGKTIKDELTGFYASLLYTASIYIFVITGIFILPDTPQSFFWLLALFSMLKSLPFPNSKTSQKQLLWFGLFAGLAIISKYTAVFLWFGAGCYIVFYKREWFTKRVFYFAVIISIVISLPIIIWNIQNHFISFTFHGERVDMIGHSLNVNAFITEIIGEFFYNNPVNFILVFIAIVAYAKHRLKLNPEYGKIIFLSGAPLIIVFILFSLFRHTLPHWTAPGYTTLLFLVAVWLTENITEKKRVRILSSALGFLIIVLLVGFLQINYGLLYHEKSTIVTKTGSNDPSLDMYGFKQAGEAFKKIVYKDSVSGFMSGNIILTGNNWFPLANFDYYAASPLNMKTLAIGQLQNIHEYAWINIKRGGFQKGMNAYYLTDTRYFNPPDKNLKSYFKIIYKPDTIPIYRRNKIAKYLFVYRLKNLIKIPDNPLKKVN